MSIGKLTTITTSSTSILGLEWDDGLVSHVNLASLIAAHSNLTPLMDPAEFEKAALSADGWSVEWPCGIDLGAQQLRRWS